jgi:membrane-associated phospholipid phosphatase
VAAASAATARRSSIRAVLVFIRRQLPRGPRDLAWQILLFCGAYWVYRIVRGLVDDRVAAAFANARHIVHLEQTLGIFSEPSVQGFTEAHEALSDVASWVYVNAQFVVTTAILAYIYLRRNDSFYFVRNMFMVSMGIALVLYVTVPTAPPRFLPELGFTDSVANFTGVHTDGNSVLVNPYAAIPSMHVCFALMIGLPMARMVRRRWVAVLWRVYPLLIALAVVATANHWWIDAVLGAATAALSWAAAAGVFARVRPEAWAWDPQGVAASA